jgi:hypothetical protein
MKAISAALVKAQKEFGPALKSSTNPHFRSKYADLAACVEAVIDALNNNGIYLMQLTEEHESGVKVSTVFIHESGEQLSGGSLFMPATKQDAQGFGSALSYARRYSLMAACGIAPEDDDANSAKAPAPRPAAAPKMQGKDTEWQLKITANPDTSFDDWLSVVVEATIFALDTAKNKDDVMNIFRTNRNIYDKIQTDDAQAYAELTATFKTYKESFNEQ